MAQLKFQGSISVTPELRWHIDENIDEVENALPSDSQLNVHVRKSSKHLYSAELRTRVLGRMLIVKEEDPDLFQAVSRARRQILRQIEAVRTRQRERQRNRHRNAHERALGFRHLLPVGI